MSKSNGKSIIQRAKHELLAKMDADQQAFRIRFARCFDQLDAYVTQKLTAQQARQQQQRPDAPQIAPPPVDPTAERSSAASEADQSDDPQLSAFFEHMKRVR